MCRKAIAYLLRTKCFMSFQEIAAYMNRIDHTTAMHNVESWTDLSESDRVMLLKAVDKAMEA
jgi:chromosomal replication initiation ATPase DnaA